MILNCDQCGTHMPAEMNAAPPGELPACPDCSRWTGQPIILRADHPYVKEFNPSIFGPYESPKPFRVKWRDFSTMKHDYEFETRLEAEEFAGGLIMNCRRVQPWLCGFGDESFEEMNARWVAPEPEPPPRARFDDFYRSREWRELRYRALKRDGARCVVCGRTRAHGIVIHVDHIEPRSKRPDLELVLSNLQVMCDGCNLGKGNKDSIDWRAQL